MDKPFKTIDEQIEILESRGVSVGPDAFRVLRREGYYSVVNGYKDPFIDKDASRMRGKDVYRAGTRFEDMYALFCFDRNLRMTMLRYFAMAEATLKTVCSYQFASRYGDQLYAYLDPGNYRDEDPYRNRIRRLIGDFNKALGRSAQRSSKGKEYILHYLREHDEVPIWIVLRRMTFGQAFKFFEFQTGKVRSDIARSYSSLYRETHEKPYKIHDRKLRLVYDHVKDFRNICAHEERLYCARVAPSRDISLMNVIDDLGLVLTGQESLDMANEVVDLLQGVTDSIGPEKQQEVMATMGVRSMDDIAIRE